MGVAIRLPAYIPLYQVITYLTLLTFVMNLIKVSGMLYYTMLH